MMFTRIMCMKLFTKLIFFTLMYLILTSCVSKLTEPTGFVKSTDDVSIYYEARGHSDTAIVFVHCWSCDHEIWREQVDEIDDQYKVVTLDLGGHGKSSANRETWSIAGLAQDVVAVINELNLNKVILVGSSMGGPVSLEVARLLPNKVIGIVAADTLHDAEYEFPPEQAEEMIAAFENDFVGTLTTMFNDASGKLIDPNLQQWILNKVTGADPNIAIALLRDYAYLDLPKMFSDARVPIRAINAEPAPMIPPTNIEVNRKYADFDAVIMKDVGHFLHLESPGQFNTYLHIYIEELKNE